MRLTVAGIGLLGLAVAAQTRPDRITLTIDEYRELRSDPLLFAVLPAHEIPDVEDVVQQMSGWLVVRKKAGEAAAVARATDD